MKFNLLQRVSFFFYAHFLHENTFQYAPYEVRLITVLIKKEVDHELFR